jgi:hypothetical protein
MTDTELAALWDNMAVEMSIQLASMLAILRPERGPITFSMRIEPNGACSATTIDTREARP